MVGVARVGRVRVSRGVGDTTSTGLSLVEGIGAVASALKTWKFGLRLAQLRVNLGK